MGSIEWIVAVRIASILGSVCMHRADYRPDHGDGDKQHADASEQEYENCSSAGPPPEIIADHGRKAASPPHAAREHAERDGAKRFFRKV